MGACWRRPVTAVLTGGYSGQHGRSQPRRGRGRWAGDRRHLRDLRSAGAEPVAERRDQGARPAGASGCMMERADGFVAVRGGIGTLSEVTLAWSLLQTGSLIRQAARVARPGLAGARRCFPARTDLGNSIAALRAVVSYPGRSVRRLLAASPYTSQPSASGLAGPGGAEGANGPV